jgi:hypothetical protein
VSVLRSGVARGLIDPRRAGRLALALLLSGRCREVAALLREPLAASIKLG